MQNYQYEFIKFSLANEVLCFGDFKLKSGRQSPYFFNTGLFNTGNSLKQLGYFYACAIKDSGINFDMLFGPAYKGIPLVSSVAIAFAEHFDRDLPYCFNRKEIKDHGEGGMILGAPLEGNVLIIDDVISAGTSVNLAVDTIRYAKAKPAGVAIAMDRQERGKGAISAVQEVEQQHNITVISIITLEDMIEYLQDMPDMSRKLEQIQYYRGQFGI